MKKWIFFILLSFSLVYSQEIMPLKDVKPGMVGHGITVFKGDKIEKFQVEVVDVMRKVFPATDVILVRCRPSVGSYDIEHSGIIAGMSGSPIYIEGKLVGALALGWTFSKEPYAGVMPIESMLKVAKRSREKQVAQIQPRNFSAGGLTPLQTPLLVSGVTSATLEKMQKAFSDIHLLPMHGISGGGEQEEPGTIRPGGAIGVQLMSGDIDMTAIGTVTWVKDKEVLAFGHSFYNGGEFHVPMTSAKIVSVMPTSMVSFKLGYSTGKVGTLLQDRIAGIYGQLGKKCSTVPLKVNVKNQITTEGETFHVDLVRHPFFTPRLCVMAIFNFIDFQESTFGRNTVEMKMTINLKDHPPITWTDIYANEILVAAGFTDLVTLFARSPFEVPDIVSIDVELETKNQFYQALVNDVKVTPGKVKPGDDIKVSVYLQPSRGEEEVIEIPWKIPADAPKGSFEISIMGGKAYHMLPMFREIPRNKERYLEFVQRWNHYKNSDLILQMDVPALKVVYKDKEMKDLPGSVISNLITDHTKALEVKSSVHTTKASTPYVILGNANVLVEIETE